MITLTMVPLFFSIGLSLVARPLTSHMHPRAAVVLLTVTALSAALCTGLAFGVCGVLAVGQWDPVSDLGRWSQATLRQQSEFPVDLGVVAFVVMIVCLSSAMRRGLRSLRELRYLSLAARDLTPATAQLVVVDDAEAIAYAVPGRGGRVVVSTSMLKALSSTERRVLIAHEFAHLDGRHYAYRHLVRLAAAANPLLRPVVRAVDFGLERWADEVAVQRTGSRSVVARALTNAALLTTRRPMHALAANGADVLARVDALSLPPLRRRPILLGVVLAAALCCWLAAGGLAVWGDTIVQHAEISWAHS